MIRKKIILLMLVLGLCITGITQAYNDPNGRAYGYINAGEMQILPNKGTINGLTQQGNFIDKSFVNYYNNERGEYVLGYIIKNDTFYFLHGVANRQLNKQGYLTKRQICNGTGYKGEEGMFYSYCDEEWTNIDLTLINQVDQIQYYNFQTENNDSSTLCLIDNSQGKSYCLSCGYNGCASITDGNGLLFDSTNYLDREYRESQGENAPRIENAGGGDGFDEIPENGFPDTNRGVYDAYGEAGYYKGLCYSDFSINSLATLSGGLQQFYEIEREDGEYYTGAKITDLRLYYGSGQDFSSWFNYWYIQYKNSLALSTTNVNPAVNYVGKSKGLWYMIYKYYGAGLGNSSINYTKFYNFCSYFQDFNINDGTADDEYSGPNLPDEVSLLVQNNLQFGTGILGHFTGDDLSFDAESFFDGLTTRLNDLLSSPDSSYTGVIPSYILMVLMALIFIRLISH